MQRSASRCDSDWMGAPRKAREKRSTQVPSSERRGDRTSAPEASAEGARVQTWKNRSSW